jgi:glycosyltransferase involved in cell wall biosynthesis
MPRNNAEDKGIDSKGMGVRVLLANKFFFLNGGSETVFFQERDFLRSNGVEVCDLSMQDERNLPSETASYFVRNVNYRAGGGGGLGRLNKALSFIHSHEAVRKVEALVAAHRPQIAHLHNIYHQLTPAIIPALRRQGVKVVLTLHDYKLVCPSYVMLKEGKVCADCEGKQFLQPVVRHCQGSYGKEAMLAAEALWHRWRGSYDGVDLFLSPSRFLADLVTQSRGARNRIRVLRNGIDASLFVPTGRDDGYGLYFGRLSNEKGIATLLSAHAAIGGGGGFPFKVVGTGPQEAFLRESYPKAEFLGYKAGAELRALVANASFVVVPSEWYENCSMVVLEAMALAKPVIGARIGGIPEQVEDGVTGLLFPSGDKEALGQAMACLWSDPPLRTRMGAAARVKLEREYSLEHHCRDLLGIYEELLSRSH